MTDLIPYSIDRVTEQLLIANKILFLISILMIIITITAIASLVIYIINKKKNNKS